MPKNYRTPSSFFATANHEHMAGFKIQSAGGDIHEMGKIIDGIRHINAKDPNFIYTCMCKDNVTQWMFAYSNRDVSRQANITARKMFLELRDEILDGYIPNLPHIACSCPLGK